MAYTIKKNIDVYVIKESTPWSHEAPGAASDAVKAKTDGFELTPSKDLLEKDELGQGLSASKSLTGLETVTGAMSVYAKANGIEGTQPEIGPMLESGMGSVRLQNTQNLDHTSATSTTTVLEFDTTPEYEVGDVVLVKTAGAYEVRPVIAVGANNITLKYALSTAPADATVIGAVCTYVPTDSGHPSYSINKYVEGAVVERGIGMVTQTIGISSFGTGQLSSIDMSATGINYDRLAETPAFTPEFDTGTTPVILNACIVQDGNVLEVNEFSMTIENTLSEITDTCNGKTSIRVSSRKVTGSINPKKVTNSSTQWDHFNENTEYSLHITAHVPTATGEYKDVISYWIPKCNTIELTEGEVNNGVLTDNVTFQAFATSKDEQEIYISFI